MKLKIFYNIFFIFLVFQFTIFSQSIYSQEIIKGKVYGIHENKSETLTGASVYWMNAKTGTITEADGSFSIEYPQKPDKLIISFIGYYADTIAISELPKKPIKIKLKPNSTLKEVEIVNKQHTTYVSKMETVHTQKISGAELHKAACCNLSESFETNASVDVHYSDAVTGAKQIQLLGLAGKYSQIMTEKIPYVRGLTSPFGLGYIPGPWMESIQVSKGSSTVESGYESITGQINVEYKKPDKGEKFYLNLVGNDKGKYEINTNGRIKLSEKWSTMLLLHGEKGIGKIDENSDSFLDMPFGDQINLINRWKYWGEKLKTQFGVKYIEENRYGGQKNFNHELVSSPENGYGIGIETKRTEIFHKMGYIFDRPATSMGFIESFSMYDQNSYFGLNNYTGQQISYYANLIFQTYIGNTNNTISTGSSFVYDEYNEKLNNTVYDRTESVPGVFFQYTYDYAHLFSFIAGIRADYHNKFGVFYTPRLHVKYNIQDEFVVRASIGKGYRTANIFAENTGIFISSRDIVILEELQQEEAWNYGLSTSKDVHINNRELTINGEFFRTDFVNQIVVDMDADINKVLFYNLKGKSYSNSYQIELIYELIKHLDVTAAFRYSDVKTTINGTLQEKPLVNKYKGLLTLSYATNLKKWQFDLTTQINGDGRLPSTMQNPEEYRLDEKFPAYTIVNLQITKYFKKWNIYAGVENITDFVQDKPILASNDPFGPYFDGSMVWGPIIGRKFYAGLRLSIGE